MQEVWSIERTLDVGRPEESVTLTLRHGWNRSTRRVPAGLHDTEPAALHHGFPATARLYGNRSEDTLRRSFERMTAPPDLCLAPPLLRLLFTDLNHGFVRTATVRIEGRPLSLEARPGATRLLFEGPAVCAVGPSGRSLWLSLGERRIVVRPTARSWVAMLDGLDLGEIVEVQQAGRRIKVPTHLRHTEGPASAADRAWPFRPTPPRG